MAEGGTGRLGGAPDFLAVVVDPLLLHLDARPQLLDALRLSGRGLRAPLPSAAELQRRGESRGGCVGSAVDGGRGTCLALSFSSCFRTFSISLASFIFASFSTLTVFMALSRLALSAWSTLALDCRCSMRIAITRSRLLASISFCQSLRVASIESCDLTVPPGVY
jgi:hypothetical protein